MCLITQMGNSKGLAFVMGKWVPWFLKAGIIGLVMLAELTYGDQEAGLLCISECATCPAICSPPPADQIALNPPPSPLPPPVHHSPPPPPQVIYYYSPPHSPPPPSPPKESRPSPSTSSRGPPPPRFDYFYNMPPLGPVLPATAGILHNNSFPYNYFYASGASSVCAHALFFVIFSVQLVFFFG